jgi:hypothetical protein
MITIQLDLFDLYISADINSTIATTITAPLKKEKLTKKKSPQKIQKTIKTGPVPSFTDFCNLLLEECPDISQIISRLKTIQPCPSGQADQAGQTGQSGQAVDNKDIESIFTSIYKQYIAVKGHVQSGKTKFIMCVSLLFL